LNQKYVSGKPLQIETHHIANSACRYFVVHIFRIETLLSSRLNCISLHQI